MQQALSGDSSDSRRTLNDDYTTHTCKTSHISMIRPHDALKHHFTSLYTDLIFLQLGFFL